MEKKENIQHYPVTEDLLMDILRILITNKIKYRIEGIKQRENVVMIKVIYETTGNDRSAQDNIETLLEDYKEYMNGLVGENNLFVYDSQEQDGAQAN